MYTKQLLIGFLATLLTFGLFGTALAGSAHVGLTEAGDWQYSFNSPQTEADKAAMNHDYDPDVVAKLRGVNEKGLSDFRFNAPKTSADIAAINHVYDPAKITPGEYGKLGVGFSNRGSLICNGC